MQKMFKICPFSSPSAKVFSLELYFRPHFDRRSCIRVAKVDKNLLNACQME